MLIASLVLPLAALSACGSDAASGSSTPDSTDGTGEIATSTSVTAGEEATATSAKQVAPLPADLTLEPYGEFGVTGVASFAPGASPDEVAVTVQARVSGGFEVDFALGAAAVVVPGGCPAAKDEPANWSAALVDTHVDSDNLETAMVMQLDVAALNDPVAILITHPSGDRNWACGEIIP